MKYHIERDDEEIELEVIFNFTRGSKGTYWQPPEGDEVEIEEALDSEGNCWLDSLTAMEHDRLMEQCLDIGREEDYQKRYGDPDEKYQRMKDERYD